jgi:hypothetical protein
MPGKSKKGGGLEVKSAYKMKYKHSAFPFKSSPAKLEDAIAQGPTIGQPGQDWLEEKNRRMGEVPPHTHEGASADVTTASVAGIVPPASGRRTVPGQL